MTLKENSALWYEVRTYHPHPGRRMEGEDDGRDGEEENGRTDGGGGG